ncbi:MAG: hypothetical protein GY797_18920 [Deltaproteobacteria bacterium]|nr:hypothetical protein [Deltaproteobacteria bacterium]
MIKLRTDEDSQNRYPVQIAIRVIANIVVAIGFFLLIQTLYHAAFGTLAKTVFGNSPGSFIWNAAAIGLSLPIPLHVISIGLILQKKWLPTRWVKATWIAIVFSGCWLGVALFIKLFIIN